MRHSPLVAAGSVLVVTLVVGLGYWYATSPAPRCANAASHLGGAWDEAARARVRDSLSSAEVGHARTTWQSVEANLDARAAAWEAAFARICEANGVRGDARVAAPARALDCLEESRQELIAVVDVLTAADAEVLGGAVDGLGALPHPDRCGRPNDDSAEPPPGPAGPRAAARVALAMGRWDAAQREAEILRAEGNGLEASLVSATAAAYRSPGPETIAGLRTAIQRADRGDRDDLVARGWVTAAEIAAMGGPVEDVESVLRTAGDAVTAGGDEPSLAGRLAMARAGLALASNRPQEVPEILATILRRGQDITARSLEARALLLRGRAHRATGRHEDATADHGRALALAANLYGASHPRVATFHQELARTLDSTGDRTGAEEHERRAQALLAGRPVREP